MNFSGAKIVLTGTPQGKGGTRKHVEAELRARGAVIQSKIDFNTDMLVYGRADTVKYREAQSKGIRTVTYDELDDHLRTGKPLGQAMQEGSRQRHKQSQASQKKAVKSLKSELSRIPSVSAGW